MKRVVYLLSGILFLLIACKDDRGNHPVPYAPVNITLYVSDPQFFPLNAVGGWTYLSGGSRGIILHRRTMDDFVAFDRHCPNEPENPCGVVEVTANGFAVTDSCCGSEFQLSDGAVIKGPSSFPLRIYQTSYDGNKVDIFN